jgi:hypothetical protein
MKRVLAPVAVLVLIAVSTVLAQDKPKESPKEQEKVDVTGTWDVSIETPQGTVSPTVTYKQEGEKLTGTQQGMMGEEHLEGTVKGSQISYTITLEIQGQQITITYTGKIDGDAISGTVEFGSYGSSTWSAKRRK